MSNTDSNPISTVYSRRQVLGAASLVAASTAFRPVMAATKNPSPVSAAPEWMTLLGRSEQGGRDYEPQVEGNLPSSIKGVLYRNGPGKFETGDHRINHLLDGDGLVQKLSIQNGKPQYSNAFVRTEKFLEEEAQQKALHATWSTRRPGGMLANLGGGVDHSQAGVTVYPVNNRLVARDEAGPSYVLDPDTLATLGKMDVANSSTAVGYKAHSKFDPATGDYILAGQEFGPSMKIHTAVYNDFNLKSHQVFTAPRQVYLHDFFVSKNYFAFILHPCNFSPWKFLLGLRSFTDSLRWQAADGNIIALHPRAGGKTLYFEAPSSFMWHSLNAFEQGNNVILDFIGYDEPDHFIGEDALFKNIMHGQLGRAQSPGKIRRYKIDLNKHKLLEEIVDSENHEFPALDPNFSMQNQEVAYFAWSGLGAFNSGLKRLNYKTGMTQTFDFGSNTQVGEPIYVPDSNPKNGWIISQCLDGTSQRTFFAVFEAANIKKGPVAKIWLHHHVPISFHGAWQNA